MCPLLSKTFTEPKQLELKSTPKSDDDPLHATGLFPPPPKKLSHHFSEMAYFSTESQTSSELSSGVSSCRGSVKHTVPTAKGSAGTKLFKGVTMCPPLVPKNIFTPNLDSAKGSGSGKLSSQYRESTKSSHSGSVKRSAASNSGAFKKIQPFTLASP